MLYSRQAEKLIKEAEEGIEFDRFLDCHVHLIGQESQSSALFWKKKLFRRAFGVKNLANCEEEALKHFTSLIFDKGNYSLLAIDQVYDKKGIKIPEKTFFYVSNDTIFKIAKLSKNFLPTASIHPYRKDALEELEKCSNRGARMIKWLPNEMLIDPSDPLCIPFYEKMASLKMTLLSHVGKESALPGLEQSFGNPLLLKNALDAKVKVIMAHCATLGKDQDLESPRFEKKHSFDLFLKMMKKEQYVDLLFGDLAAVTQINRLKFLPKLLELCQPGGLLEGRILHGSDYPVTNFRFVCSPILLCLKGFITFREARILKEIFKKNPLLFDFVLKRTLKHPKTNVRFPPNIFMKNEALPLFQT